MKIDFDGMQAFVMVADLGSFSKAAERLSLTQTALSRRVQKLEGLLGQRVLERTTRHIALTPAGEHLLGQARTLVHEMSLMFSQVKNASRHPPSIFTLACVPTMVASLLPALLLRYSQTHPNMRIRLTDAASTEVREAVLSHQAELGIAIQGEKNAKLTETLLMDDPLMLFCRKDHPLSQKKQIGWSDLSAAHLIMVSSLRATRVFMNYQLAKRGLSLTGAYEVGHHSTAVHLVGAGVGCAILPASCAITSDPVKVCCIPLGHPVVKRRVVLIQRKASELSPPAAAFAELLLAGGVRARKTARLRFAHWEV